MILRLSVFDTATSRGQDIEVTAEPDTRTASLLASLPVDLGGRTCYVGTSPLDPDATIAQTPLVAGATISVGAPGPDPRALPEGAVGALRGLVGPDAGLVAWLPPGTHDVGRGSAVAVRLRDQEVSRQHAQVEASAQGRATVVDTGSANGTRVDGQPAEVPIPLTEQAVLEIGGNQLQWIPLTSARSTMTRSPDGWLEFHRAFAPAPAIPRIEVSLPNQETSSRNMAMMLMSAIAPVAIGGVMALVMGPAMLLFALVAPASVMGTMIMERRQRRERDRGYTEAKDAAEQRIGNHVITEQRLRRQLAPDELDLTLAATGRRSGLWPRNADSPHGLVLRVGTADQPASVDLRGDPWPGFETPTLHGVPVTVDLRSTGVLGVVGPAGPADALLRWLLVQLGTLRSPDELRVVVISSSDSHELAWTGWLPHVAAGSDADLPCWVGNTNPTRAARVAELKQLVTARTAQREATSAVRFTEEVVVVLDGALALRHLPGMKEVLRQGPSVGVYVICVDRQGMNECHGLCDLDSPSSLQLTRTRDEHPAIVCPDGISRDTAERLARALAPMRDRLTLAAAQNAIPYPVRFLDLLDLTTPVPDDVLALWDRRRGPTTEVVLGADASGPVSVDLARQGPHTMLGGATGAGKSILLQTLVTSLLLANRSDELNLVLVDFKGGSAFLPFQLCPHVVGLIRSTGETPADVFDEAAAARVLASVRAEVRRRESLLARYGGELDQYWKARDTTSTVPPLPRLVMVFDEFARVLETSPDFLKELVNVAAKGRSLGMHLILATQSLQGKLSPELKNNIDLRITLRQNEAADSTEVLGVPDAATIPGRLRGRGMILCTKDETRTPQAFQSGYLGNPPLVAGAVPAQVRIVEWPTLGVPRPHHEVDHGDKPTDQQLAISAIEKAAGRTGVPAPFRPLRPPLPAALSLDDLAVQATAPTPNATAPPSAVAFGLLDDPAAQAQPPAALDLAGTDRLLIAGGPQSGRTTAAHTLIASLATRFRPDQAHLYIVEHYPAGLAGYADLAHCGAVFSPAEPDRIRRFVTWLDGEVQRRSTTRFTQSAESPPWIVVIIDGWEHFENRSDPNFIETSLLTTLRGIVTSGTPLGIHLVILGGQDMMSSKITTLYSQRLLLPFPKEDTRRGHLSIGMVSPPVLPGRAIDAANGHHIQVCQPSLTPDEVATRVAYQASGVDPTQLPRQFRSLPAQITLDRLSLPEPAPSPTWFPLGMGGPDVTTLGIDLLDIGPHLVLISGPSESGRTTAAATVAHGLRRVDIGVLALAPPRSPLPRLLPADAGVRVLTGTTFKDADLREAVASFADGPYAVIIDDCEQITLTPSQEGFSDAPTLLEDIVNPGSLGRRALVMCGDAQPILTGQRRSLMRITNEILTSGARLLLTPTNRATAREHGFIFESDQYFAGPPGRGYLTQGRTTDLVQLATVPHSGRAAVPTQGGTI